VYGVVRITPERQREREARPQDQLVNV
jgi:hypothetical protein